MAEGELNVDLGLLYLKGKCMDVYADLPPLLPPSSEPSVSPVSKSSRERAPVSKFSPERAPVSKYSPERSPVSTSSPETAPVSPSGPERAPVSKSSSEKLCSQVQPCRPPVSHAPSAGSHNLPCVNSTHQPLKAQRLKNKHTHPPVPASSTAVVWKPLCSPSAHHSLASASSL